MNWLLAAGIFGFTGVAAGAFGAHALRARLSDDLLAIYNTGAHYHLLHAVALLGVGALQRQGISAHVTGYAFSAGIVVFSGSLYLLAITGTRWLGAITPIGGVCFLAGWAWLVWQALNLSSET